MSMFRRANPHLPPRDPNYQLHASPLTVQAENESEAGSDKEDSPTGEEVYIT